MKQLTEDLIKEIKLHYHLQQHTAEWGEFLDYIEEIKPNTIIEVGMASGASSLCLSHFTKKLISIDMFKPKNKTVVDEIRNHCDFTAIYQPSNSKACTEQLQRALAGSLVDVLFLDGEHSFKGISTDFKNFYPLVRPGGIIGLHDIVKSAYHVKMHCKVFRLWNSLKERHEFKEFCINSKWGGIGTIIKP